MRHPKAALLICLASIVKSTSHLPHLIGSDKGVPHCRLFRACSSTAQHTIHTSRGPLRPYLDPPKPAACWRGEIARGQALLLWLLFSITSLPLRQLPFPNMNQQPVWRPFLSPCPLLQGGCSRRQTVNTDKCSSDKVPAVFTKFTQSAVKALLQCRRLRSKKKRFKRRKHKIGRPSDEVKGRASIFSRLALFMRPSTSLHLNNSPCYSCSQLVEALVDHRTKVTSVAPHHGATANTVNAGSRGAVTLSVPVRMKLAASLYKYKFSCCGGQLTAVP